MGKQRKDSKTAMAPFRAKLEALDIKTVATWTDSTTHVVAGKRNTAIGLQALINGCHIVTEEYLDTIARIAAVPPVPEGQPSPVSPLEIDFDANWPKPEDYLPPKGHEPVTQPSTAYSPDPRRKNLFSGWTFIFCEDLQYENLLGPITDGHGKSEKFVLNPGDTRPEELVVFVQKRRQGSDVAVVRFRSNQDPAWATEFVEKVQEL
jgi:hypothetical protein